MSGSTSTPRRPSSGQAAPNLPESIQTSSVLRLQPELKTAMEEEIANQTFNFPSLELARMLSPKELKLKPGIVAPSALPLLHQYGCIVDNQPFRNALNDVVARLGTFTPRAPGAGEPAYYRDLAKFLTKCVEVCHDVLDEQEGFPIRQERWYNDLEFTVGKPVVDGVEGAPPLKPDITGGKGISAFKEERLYWKPPADKPTHRITLPVEVKKQWRAMVSQAATYARCLFSASPIRAFALVLAFNHESNTLRFLVFHRGGLAASEEYNITERDGLEEIARLFLTLASWRTAEEEGVVTCCNNSTHLLPADQQGTLYVSAAVEDILFRTLCVRGRMTSVSRLRLPTNTPPVVPESPAQNLPKPLMELSGSLRRSVRLLHKESTSSSPTTTPRERGKQHKEDRPQGPARSGSGPTTRSASRKAASLPIVPEQARDVRVQAAPDVQLKYTQPREIIRSENDPILSELTGTVVIKTSWPGTDRRSNEANMYRDSAGRFGTIPHVCSYEGVGEHGEVISNISFLPQEDDITRCYWPIFTKTPPKRLDIRTLRFTVFGVEGKSLVEAKSPRQLSRAWAHFLLGWLSTYLSGHLHRDPSLGNVLMTDTPVKRKKFEIPKEFQDHLSSLQDQTTTDAIRELCRKVEELVDAMNISDDCIAFVTDGDLAISWRDYWTKEHRATKSGTPEFMSRALLGAKGDYLHSPVDDLESCFWVSVWSVFFNKDNTGNQSGQERDLKDALINYLSKDNAMNSLRLLSHREKHSSIAQLFRPVLLEWWRKVRDRDEMWSDSVLAGEPENADGGYYLPHFHRFALQGVVDVLEVLAKHWNDKISWESWAGPGSSM